MDLKSNVVNDTIEININYYAIALTLVILVLIGKIILTMQK